MYVAETDKIKLELIKWITSLEDLDQLNMIESIKLSWSESMKDSWHEHAHRQKEEIKLGLKELDKGKGIPSAEFWRRVESSRSNEA